MTNFEAKTKAELISEIKRLQKIIESDHDIKTIDSTAGAGTRSSESAKAEEKLRESEERFRGIVENTDAGYFFIDSKGIIQEVNGAWVRMYKYDSADEIVGKHFTVIQKIDDVEKAEEVVNGILKGRAEFLTGEFSRKCKDNSIGYHSFSARPVQQRGEVIGIEGFIIDITKRMKMEETLIKDRKFTEVILNSQLDTFFVFEAATGKAIRWNKSFSDISGYSNKEIAALKAPDSYYSPDDLKKSAAFMELVFREGKGRIELSLICKDGHTVPTEYEVSVLRDEQGNPQYLISVGRDITEWKRSQNALREGEAKYKMLFNEMLDGFALHEMIFDRSGKPVDYRFLDINPAFEQMTGLTAERVIGKTVLEVIPELKSFWIETYGKVTLTGEPIRFKNYADALKKHFEITAFRPREGQFACIFIDITKQKQMEEQLRQSEKMWAIGRLAGGVAHDFNNQLGGIIGYAELLREKVGHDADLTRYVDNIIICVKRSSDLTAQLLAFSRQGKYQEITVNIHNILHEVINMLQHSMDKRIVIKQHLNAYPPITTGDPTQLQNAILNLALNARDAMPRGGELLFSTDVVQVDKSDKKEHLFEITKGAYIKICITDTGIGMNKETQQHIFEPFFTTKEKGKGTGMGLAAVYGTIKNHNGTINIYSEPDKGTTVSIYLPLNIKEEFKVNEDLQSAATVKGSAHLLLVEDEDMVRKVETELLEILGYKVSACSNGAEAVKFYKKSWKQVDLVIIDMVMPEMNGKDAFIAMREINPDIIALLASGYSLNGEARTILEEGVKGFIQKPFRKNKLSQKIAELLNLK